MRNTALAQDPGLAEIVGRLVAAFRPERVVGLDEGFAGNDPLKANAVQIFKNNRATGFKTV